MSEPKTTSAAPRPPARRGPGGGGFGGPMGGHGMVPVAKAKDFGESAADFWANSSRRRPASSP